MANSVAAGVLKHLPAPVKSAGKRLFAESLINWLLYPKLSEYEIGGITVRFSFSGHDEYTQVQHDITTERVLLEEMIRSVRPDDTIFDIGANVGTHTCILGASLSSGRIHAFEPVPANVTRIATNVRLNDLPAVVEPYALSSIDEARPLLNAASSKKAHLGYGGESNQLVRVVAADTMVYSGVLPQPTFLKIDVEGFELEVLKGFRKTLSNPACRLVYCEVHPEETFEHGLSSREETELRQLLTNRGFQVSRLDEDSGSEGPYHLKAEAGS